MNILQSSLVVLAAVAATSSGVAAVGEEEISAAASKQAAGIYAARCASCHGAEGKADGAMAAALSPRPRDLTTAEWQKSVTDEYIETIILKGGSAVGKSMMMPGNPDLAGKPEVVRALRVMVRKFGGE